LFLQKKSSMKRTIIAVALATLAGTAQAQMAPPSAAIPAALDDVHTGTLLRVRAQRQNGEGRYSGLTRDALVLGITPGNSQPIDFDEITDIWKRGSNWKRGAIIGGITGTVLTSAAVIAIGTAACEQPDGCRGDIPTLIFFSALIGGGSGALVGGGLGYLAKRWVKIY
jgi:hypothetical protein